MAEVEGWKAEAKGPKRRLLRDRILGQPVEQFLGLSALVLLAAGCALVLWPFVSALM